MRGSIANAAFAAANTGGGGGGTTDAWARDTANASFLQANSAASFANGAFVTANASYASQNTTASFANGAFTAANTADGKAVSAGSFANGAFGTANASYTAQNTTAGFANSAYAHANAAYLAANTGGGGGGADAWARDRANAAFAKANTEIIIFAVTDDTSNITVSSARASFRAPSAMTLTSIPRASLNVASTSGVVTCDIKLNGTTILGANKLSIDATEKTSTTAATPTTLATTSIADDAEITVDITAAGTGAKGLKLTFYYND